MDIVTVSWGWLNVRPLVGRETDTVGLETVVDGMEVCCDVGRPTSNGSNLLGDSPIILPLAEAASDISGFDWKEEIEEQVSSVIDGRKGVLSDRLAGGEGP